MEKSASLEISTPTISPQARAVFYIVLSGILYGLFGFFGVKIMGAPLSLNSMLFWRFLFATLSMLLVCGVAKPPLSKKLAPWIMDFGLGALLYGGCSSLYFLATDTIGTGLAMVIFFSYPAMVILFSRVFDGVLFSKLSILSLVLVFAGFAMMGGHGGGPDELKFSWSGAFLSTASALFYATYIYLSKKQLNASHPLMSSLNLCLGSTLLFFVLAQLEGGLQTPPHTSAWVYCILMGLLCTSIPILLLLEGLKTISASKAALLTILEPVITVLIGAAFLSEKVDLTQGIGMVVILVGAAAGQFEKD